MRVLILGANGMLGHTLKYVLESKNIKVLSHTRQHFDPLINSISDLSQIYSLSKGDYVVNTIVHDPKDIDIEKVYTINSVFAHQLGYYCKINKLKLIQISTNGVFSGKKGNYVESDVPDATDHYGKSKLLGESAFAMVLRTSILGHSIQKRYLLDWVISQRNKTIQGYTNHYWNGVTTLELANYIHQIILHNRYKNGIYHIYSNKSYSKYELLKLINLIYNLQLIVEPINHPQEKILTIKSLYQTSNVKKQLMIQLEELKRFTKNISN